MFALVVSIVDFSWGPTLCIAGTVGIASASLVHGVAGRPTILPARAKDETFAPNLWERLSVHLIAYSVWAILFGAVVWRGVPTGMIDVRLPFEREWPVVQNSEWIYVSVYLVPMVVPWLPVSRRALRRYAWDLWWLLAISVAMFALLPLGAPPRMTAPTTPAGHLLAWETGRPDFAAASLPSFHVFWGLLVAQVVATCGGWLKWIGRGWAAAVVVACMANGAHALADVAASLAIYGVLLALRKRAAGSQDQAAADLRLPTNQPSMRPASSPTASAPPP